MKTAPIAFKAAYSFNPNDTKDMKAIKKLQNREEPSAISMVTSSKYDPEKLVLLTDETCSKFNESGLSFDNFVHDKGINVLDIKYTKLYRLLNFSKIRRYLCKCDEVG